jgi:hypothetical protein
MAEFSACAGRRPLLYQTNPADETHIWDWNRDLKYSNWGYAYCNGLLYWLKALTCSDLDCYYWWVQEPVRQFVLYENNFFWMDVRVLKPGGWDRFG